MKPVHRVTLTLKFEDELTTSDLVKLEAYLIEGLTGKDWGPFKIYMDCQMVGFAASEKKSKGISKEELLELEKKGAKK